MEFDLNLDEFQNSYGNIEQINYPKVFKTNKKINY